MRQIVSPTSSAINTSKGHIDNLIAIELISVPASMFADKRSALIFARQILGGVKNHADRCHVGAQCIVRTDRLGDEVGPLRIDPRVDILAEIAVGPSVKATVLDRRHVIRNQVRAEFVTLVNDGPKGRGLRFPTQSVGIAQAMRKNTEAARRSVDLPDRGAILLGLHTVLGDIAVRADADIERSAVLAGNEALRPVVVDRSTGSSVNTVPGAVILVSPG